MINVVKTRPNRVLPGRAVGGKNVKAAVDGLGGERAMLGAGFSFGDAEDCIADCRDVFSSQSCITQRPDCSCNDSNNFSTGRGKPYEKIYQ